MGETQFKDPIRNLYGHRCSKCENLFYIQWIGRSKHTMPMCIECGNNENVHHVEGEMYSVYKR